MTRRISWLVVIMILCLLSLQWSLDEWVFHHRMNNKQVNVTRFCRVLVIHSTGTQVCVTGWHTR